MNRHSKKHVRWGPRAKRPRAKRPRAKLSAAGVLSALRLVGWQRSSAIEEVGLVVHDSLGRTSEGGSAAVRPGRNEI